MDVEGSTGVVQESGRKGGWTGLRSWALAAAIVVAPLALGGPAQAAVMPYTTVPNAVASSSYTLAVNGQPVFVEKFGDVSLARFAFSGEAKVQLTASSAISGASISPQSYGLKATVDNRNLSFALSQPRTLVLRVDGLEKLLLFADGPEHDAPVPGSPGVTSLTGYLSPTRDPQVPVTAALQRAINEVAAGNGGAGGVLYVPSGLYMSTQLSLRSNVHLYLESGALIRAVPVFNAGNYPIQHGADSSFIYIPDARNVKLSGRGVIDGNGYQLRSNTPGGGNCKLLRTKNSSAVTLEDLYFRDSARWTIHLLGSDNISVRGVKLVNDLRPKAGESLPLVSNTDAFDLDASRFVTVENSFIYTTDDAFSAKVTGYMGVKKPAHDLVMRNNVLWTQKVSFRAGSEVLDDIYNVSFDNNDTLLADRLLAMWNEGGYTIRDVMATHNRSETIGVADNRSFFYHYIRTKPGYIDRITVDGLQALQKAPLESRMEGYDEGHRISNFAVKNMYVAGVPMTTTTDVPLKMRNAYVSNITVTPPGADGAPSVQVSASDDRGIEGSDSASFVFSRSGALDVPLTLRYTLSGTATPGQDYAAQSGALTIPAGAQQASLTVKPLSDRLVEADEFVTLSLNPDAGYVRGRYAEATLTLADGPVPPEPAPAAVVAPAADAAPLPVISIALEDGAASEARAPANGGRVRISRSGSTARALTVRVSFGGTATPGVDYPAMSETVTIPAGMAFAKLSVWPNWDGKAEKAETVIVGAAPASGYTADGSSGRIVIANVD